MITLETMALPPTLVLTLFLAGCGGGDDPGAPDPTPAPVATPAAVPTQDEADAEAERSITPANADDKLDRLQRELERERGDG